MNANSNMVKKELKTAYKNRLPDPGIIGIFLKSTDECCLATTTEIKNLVNRTKFTLDLGSHSDQNLQKKWNAESPEKRELRVLGRLTPDKEEPWRDYSEDLQILKLEWEEKLTGQGIQII